MKITGTTGHNQHQNHLKCGQIIPSYG